MKKPRQRARAGEGSVFQLASGKWAAVISVGGRGNRRMVRRKSDTEAQAWEALRRLRAEFLNYDPFDERPLPLEQHLKAWLDEMKPRVRPKTWVTYELVLRLHVTKFDPVLAAMTVDRIRPAHIAKLMAGLTAAGVSPRVRELAYLRLRAAFARSVGKTVRSNPVLPIHRPRVERRTMTIWTAEESRAFLEANKNEWLAVLYRLALSVGLRRGELLGLRWTDVDLKARRLSIQHTATEEGELAEPKTPGSRRAIELPQRAADALLAQREKLLGMGLRASPWVFPSEDGGPFLARRLTRDFNAAIARAELEQIRFHDLRHTCATLRLQAGDHPKVVSEMLGHASIEITLDLYSHVAPSMQREAADRFDAIL